MSLVPAPPKSSTMGGAVSLQKCLFTLFGDSCDVNLLGPRCHFWPDRLTIEHDTEIFI